MGGETQGQRLIAGLSDKKAEQGRGGSREGGRSKAGGAEEEAGEKGNNAWGRAGWRTGKKQEEKREMKWKEFLVVIFPHRCLSGCQSHKHLFEMFMFLSIFIFMDTDQQLLLLLNYTYSQCL